MIHLPALGFILGCGMLSLCISSRIENFIRIFRFGTCFSNKEVESTERTVRLIMLINILSGLTYAGLYMQKMLFEFGTIKMLMFVSGFMVCGAAIVEACVLNLCLCILLMLVNEVDA
jgi:hypothetical protein